MAVTLLLRAENLFPNTRYCLLQDKVTVDFYAEALCPYCALATTSVVAPIFQSGLSNYTIFRYIPYGNAKNSSQVCAVLEASELPDHMLPTRCCMCLCTVLACL